VSGAAALILQVFPDASPAELAAALQDRALDLGSPGPDNRFGVGRLSLGTAPDNPNGPAPTPPRLADLQPTSTARPPDAAVGLPGTSPGSLQTQDDDGDLGALFISLGLCFVCFGAVLFVGVLVVGLVAMRRR
jgi:hypothetical protein